MLQGSRGPNRRLESLLLIDMDIMSLLILVALWIVSRGVAVDARISSSKEDQRR